jgi:diguanylate cyclase (GGDEF)-like protein/PAS domain S-box-containing protein
MSEPVFYKEIALTMSPILLSRTITTEITVFFLICMVVILCLSILSILLVINRQKNKKSLRIIENSNALIKTFINADASMIYLKDENLKYVFVNNAIEHRYGKKAEDIIGLDDYEFSDKASADIKRSTDIEALRQGRLVIDEIDWNGHVYQTTKFPVRMLNGAWGVGAYVKDVTQERERELRQMRISDRNKILADVLSLGFHDSNEQLNYVLHRCLDLTESQYGYIFLFDEDEQELTLNSWSKGVMEVCGIASKQVKFQLENTGLWGEVIRQRKPIVINDFEAPNVLKKGYPEGHVALKRYLSIPVIIDERIVAVVGLANKKADYDMNDVYETTLLMNGVWHDIEKRSAQEILAYERNKYLQTLISIGDGVLVVDKAGKIEMLNRMGEKLTGWTYKEARGRDYKEVFKLSHDIPHNDIQDPVEEVYKTGEIQELGSHVILTSKDGTHYYIEDSGAPIKDEVGANAGVVLVFRDVTEKKEQHRKIEYLSFHDALTGLYNRRFFEEELLRIDKEENLPITIAMGDVNGLKLTNDIFGHTYGDLLIQNLSQVLKDVCRSEDIIVRWGGDEFIILLPKTTNEEAQKLMALIKLEYAKKRVKAIKGSVSIGIETKQSQNENLSILLTSAEEKMYAAKSMERDAISSDTVKAIISSLHENSAREKDHSLHVSELCYQLAKAMDFSEKKLRQLRDVGYLHDIGKIVLDPKILNKDYKLTTEEWNEVKRHPIVGFRILNSFDDTLDLAESVLAHQERWDGLGYPKGLKGKEIPVMARIIAVAESYDRMIHDSDNIKAMNKDEAIKVIKENSATQFDPKIAEFFVELMSFQERVNMGMGSGRKASPPLLKNIAD